MSSFKLNTDLVTARLLAGSTSICEPATAHRARTKLAQFGVLPVLAWRSVSVRIASRESLTQNEAQIFQLNCIPK